MTQNQLRLIPELNLASTTTSTTTSTITSNLTSTLGTPSRSTLRTRRTSRGFSPINLTLIEGSVAADFGIDERTRNIGLSGIAAAREMLRQANEALAA